MPELAVLVPVLNRPQNVAPLVESFLTHRPEDSYMVLIANVHDFAEREAMQPHLSPYVWGTKLEDDIASWPEKINYGVRAFAAEWYLCAADDIAFTPGWWEATKELRDDSTVGVIGTNDSATGSGNPRVTAGEHTCHPLVRASYIRERGTIDVRGRAVHPGYHHWYVDDELIWTAKSRGAWAFCRDAVIEHLHPYWGKAEWDSTYALGEANAEADRQLFKSRAHLFGVQVG